MQRPAPACVPQGSRCTAEVATGRQTTPSVPTFVAPSVTAGCARCAQCLRTPDTTPVRTIVFFHGRVETDGPTHTARMQARLDAPAGREAYGRRFAMVEPVFGDLRANKRLDRFTLRGRAKVHGQWTLYCLVHNIEKLAHAR